MNIVGKLAIVAAMVLAAVGANALPSLAEAKMGSRAFAAIYATPRHGVMTQQREFCDGHGKFRIEVNMPDMPSLVTIYDTNNQTVIGWTAGAGQYTVHAMTEYQNPTGKANAKANWKPLGTKNIDGHNCHGWLIPAVGNVPGQAQFTESWVDDEYGVPVITSAGAFSMKLTSITPMAPNAAMFAAPAGYTQGKSLW